MTIVVWVLIQLVCAKDGTGCTQIEVGTFDTGAACMAAIHDWRSQLACTLRPASRREGSAK